MNRITLNNNIQMPMIGFGTFLMGGSKCEESVLTAIRSGYRLIDTAEAYGWQRNREKRYPPRGIVSRDESELPFL